jgi:hypothetical protein
MDRNRLSELYGVACARIQQAGSDLYEDLHHADGDPIGNLGEVVDKLALYKRYILSEVDFIREVVRECEDGGQ